MLQKARRARSQFVMLIKICVHLIRVKPRQVNYWPISLLSHFNRLFLKTTCIILPDEGIY